MAAISYTSLQQSVESATGGLCTVIYDDAGYPNYMRRFPKVQIEDLMPDLGLSGTHPAFIVNGTEVDEIYISMYLATNILDSCAVALPGLDPYNNINFNDAVTACTAKGTGWHLMTNAEWSLVQMTCVANGFYPHGNTRSGKDISYPYETGTLNDAGNRTLTGSGPITWRHDNSIAGVADIVGNVTEWTAGFRLNNGEIQIMQDNNAALTSQDHSSSSSAWKAILQDGSLVSPGTTNTLKFDSVNPDSSGNVGNAELSTTVTNPVSTGYCQQTFASLTAQDGITIPPILQMLGIMPYSGVTTTDNIWICTAGERFPYRGGGYFVGTGAGLWYLTLTNLRSNRYAGIGFRPAYCAQS